MPIFQLLEQNRIRNVEFYQKNSNQHLQFSGSQKENSTSFDKVNEWVLSATIVSRIRIRFDDVSSSPYSHECQSRQNKHCQESDS
jgi:hypothetical protein